MKRRVDFLVIGSGLAGMMFALKAAGKGKVLLVTKAGLEESNTRYAQGGIAAVLSEKDSFEKHIEDTLISGDGLCNREVVEMVVREAPEKIRELMALGVEFDRNARGEPDLSREGGHSESRILHFRDVTGRNIVETLVRRVREEENIEVWENAFAIDLLTQHHLGRLVKRWHSDIACYGAYVLDLKSRDVVTVLARMTVVATGGVGNLYQTTTNPPVATGDGVAMVYRAKGIIENMEFVQFHPTSLYHPGERPSFLITEALRGFGAVLRTIDGKKFMHKYDERGCLAPRDIVARAIDTEMKVRGDDFVYLDCTHLDGEELVSRFPNIHKKCLSIGIDMRKEMIPVVPAAHYLCGGVRVDKMARTSISRLYAVGEVASTGMHGANRLASNSLLEAVVFADHAAEDAVRHVDDHTWEEKIPEWDYEGTSHPEEMILVTQDYKEMQMVMSHYVGIVRSNLRLQRALTRLEIIYNETEELYEKSVLSRKLCELRNLINVGYLVIKMAQARHESRGLHYNIDYPEKNAQP
jgi:L-aspartate oxidase